MDNQTPIRVRQPEIMLLPQWFRQHGYFTASLGKVLHLGIDETGERKFYRDPKSFADNRDFKATRLGLKGEGRNLTNGELPWCSWLAAEGSADDQPDGQNATEAIKLIEQHRDQPFFIGVGFHKPHDPFHAPKEYFAMYPTERIQLAREPEERSPRLPLAIPNPAGFAKFTDQERREFRRAYFAGITFMDAQVGRVLDTLDRLQLWENTIVVFFSDHGYHLGEHGWWNKVTLFELSARVPLIVWGPGAAGMSRSTPAIVELLDLFPTLVELAGLKTPPGLEGVSFQRQLERPTTAGKQAAYTQVARGARMGRSVRTERWRYTEWDEGRAGAELYDHTNDAGEYRNLAEDPRHAPIVEAMKALLRRP